MSEKFKGLFAKAGTAFLAISPTIGLGQTSSPTLTPTQACLAAAIGVDVTSIKDPVVSTTSPEIDTSWSAVSSDNHQAIKLYTHKGDKSVIAESPGNHSLLRINIGPNGSVYSSVTIKHDDMPSATIPEQAFEAKTVKGKTSYSVTLDGKKAADLNPPSRLKRVQHAAYICAHAPV